MKVSANEKSVFSVFIVFEGSLEISYRVIMVSIWNFPLGSNKINMRIIMFLFSQNEKKKRKEKAGEK
jgi:hypothetical protein